MKEHKAAGTFFALSYALHLITYIFLHLMIGIRLSYLQPTCGLKPCKVEPQPFTITPVITVLMLCYLAACLVHILAYLRYQRFEPMTLFQKLLMFFVLQTMTGFLGLIGINLLSQDIDFFYSILISITASALFVLTASFIIIVHHLFLWYQSYYSARV